MHFLSFYNLFKNKHQSTTANINADELELILILRKIPEDIKQNIIDLIKSIN